VLLEELRKRRDGDIEGIVAVVLRDALDFGRRDETLCLLQRLELRLRVAVEGI
jgi:hypothetical protein